MARRKLPPVPPRARPDLGADILAERDARARAAQIRVEGDVEERQIAHAVGEAAGVALPYSRWQELDPDVRLVIERLAGPSLGLYEQALRDGRDVPADSTEVKLTEEQVKRRAVELEQQVLHDYDDRSYVWLWDPPKGGFHWSKSRFHVTQMKRAMEEKGFCDRPTHPIAPEPDVPCGYVNPVGVACEKFLRNAEEKFAHQAAKHKDWWRNEQDRRVREREDLQIELLRVIAQQGRAATPAGPAPVPADVPNT